MNQFLSLFNDVRPIHERPHHELYEQATEETVPAASEGPMKESYQVAVVGAGVSGMVAARTLAKHGLDVVVLEASDAVGGRGRLGLSTTLAKPQSPQNHSTLYPPLHRHKHSLLPSSPTLLVRTDEVNGFLLDRGFQVVVTFAP